MATNIPDSHKIYHLLAKHPSSWTFWRAWINVKHLICSLKSNLFHLRYCFHRHLDYNHWFWFGHQIFAHHINSVERWRGSWFSHTVSMTDFILLIFIFIFFSFLFLFFFWVCRWAFDRTHEPHKDIFVNPLQYMESRIKQRGYFATVFPDEGCLANPRWRMSCKWCQIVKLSCCATFPWPSQNSKTKDVLRRRGPPGSLTLVAEPCADVAKKMFCEMWFVQVRHVVDLPLTGFFFRSTSGQEFPVGFANNSIYLAFWTGPCFSTFFSQLV